MKTIIRAIVLSAVCFSVVSAHGKMLPFLMAPFNSTIVGLFGSNTNVSASMEWEWQNPVFTNLFPYEVAFAEGKFRFDLDLTRPGTGLKPEEVAQLKSMFPEVVLWRLDEKKMFKIFPGQKSYTETRLSDDQWEVAKGKLKIETTNLGEETVDGHSCRKTKAVVTDVSGDKYDLTLWLAVDLNGFPIKVEEIESGNRRTLLFRNVKLSKPDDSRFELPSDFKSTDSESKPQTAKDPSK